MMENIFTNSSSSCHFIFLMGTFSLLQSPLSQVFSGLGPLLWLMSGVCELFFIKCASPPGSKISEKKIFLALINNLST